MIRIAGSGRFRCTPWPPDKKAIDIGDFYADSSLIQRELGWRAVTTLADGLERTLRFYRANIQHYVPTTESTVGAL